MASDLTATITGRIGNPPRKGATKLGARKISLSVAVLTSKVPDARPTWVTIMAYEDLATQVADLEIGDVITAHCDSVFAFAQNPQRGSSRARVCFNAQSIECQRLADGHGVDAEQAADLSVLNGTVATEGDDPWGTPPEAETTTGVDLMAGVNGH